MLVLGRQGLWGGGGAGSPGDVGLDWRRGAESLLS